MFQFNVIESKLVTMLLMNYLAIYVLQVNINCITVRLKCKLFDIIKDKFFSENKRVRVLST